VDRAAGTWRNKFEVGASISLTDLFGEFLMESAAARRRFSPGF